MSSFFKKIGRLEIIVFVAGTVVMILELIGSRILAPYLGTSIFVWASLIGLILGALSLGYYLGGYFSKTNPSYKFLSITLVLAGFFIVLITLIKEPVLKYSMSFGIKLGSVMATTALFVVPSILLGMISPYSVRLKVKNLETSGSAAGSLYAISTVGSIFGTFLAGFWLIPHFGSLNILFGLGLILILTSFLGWSKGNILMRLVIIFLICLIFVLGKTIILSQGFIVDTDSSYNHIRVYETIDPRNNQKAKILQLGREVHSLVYLDSDDFTSFVKFYRLDRIFKPKINSALVVGGGAYLLPRDILKRFDEVIVDVVEIDPKVTQMAKEYFAFKENKRIDIFHQDGRIFLNDNEQKYDAIYFDVFFSSFSIPFQLTTKESTQRIYDSLTNDGIFLVALVSTLDGEKSLFFKSEYKTISEIFPQVYVFPVKSKTGGQVQNMMLVATKEGKELTEKELFDLAVTEEEVWLTEHLYQEPVNLEGIKILTDDHAPVDYYVSKIL